MKESCREGPASHPDPESCGDARKGGAEALTGVHAGTVLSREIRSIGVPTLLNYAEGNTWKGDTASPPGPRAVVDPFMRGSSMHENREIPCPARIDGKPEDWKRTEAPWPRVPRDGKCGEGDQRYHVSSWAGKVGEGEPRRLNRREQVKLVQALRVALMRCQERGIDGEIWRDMLYDANLGLEPQNLEEMRNLLKAIIGRDPMEGDTRPKGEKQPDRERSEASESPLPILARVGKVDDRNPTMDGQGKSDRPVVPMKEPNKAREPAAEAPEGRGLTKGNSLKQNTPRTQSRVGVPSALERVRQAARRDKKARFTALMHHITVDRLRQAYLRIKRTAAAGVDGTTWKQYGERLEENLQVLHAKLHKGGYRAKASRRAYIPKADGRQRPLGIVALEDKIVQGAVVEVLNAIYEEDFLGFSYGFRPGRSQHQALDALAVGILRKKVNWVLDADIRGFFDAIDHGWMVKFLQHRIADRRILRLVQKWLAAGVMEDGKWTESELGTPQGATVSPLLANLYLHYVFDLWAQQWRKRYARGDVVIVRYADDFVMGFQHHEDAKRFLDELRIRMRNFALELHPEKTRLI